MKFLLPLFLFFSLNNAFALEKAVDCNIGIKVDSDNYIQINKILNPGESYRLPFNHESGGFSLELSNYTNSEFQVQLLDRKSLQVLFQLQTLGGYLNVGINTHGVFLKCKCE